jgi:hypothetical protein
MQKYSSNVIEKCFEKSHEIVLSKYVEEISQYSRVIELMKHSYGNYVVQKVLKISQGTTKHMFIYAIMKNIEKLGERKLVNKWKTIIGNSLNNVTEKNMFSFNFNCPTQNPFYYQQQNNFSYGIPLLNNFSLSQNMPSQIPNSFFPTFPQYKLSNN